MFWSSVYNMCVFRGCSLVQPPPTESTPLIKVHECIKMCPKTMETCIRLHCCSFTYSLLNYSLPRVLVLTLCWPPSWAVRVSDRFLHSAVLLSRVQTYSQIWPCLQLYRTYFNTQLCQFSPVVKWKLQLKKVNCAVVVFVQL